MHFLVREIKGFDHIVILGHDYCIGPVVLGLVGNVSHPVFSLPNPSSNAWPTTSIPDSRLS